MKHVFQIISSYILNILSIFLLLKQNIYLLFYVIGCIFNKVVNLILKNIFQDPRPNEDIALFELALHNGQHLNIERYGMPSGTSQNIGFSSMFIFLTTNNIYVIWTYLIISFLSMLQSYYTKEHTISQIIIGYIIGMTIGFMFYIMSEKFIKGKITNKKDDFCFVC